MMWLPSWIVVTSILLNSLLLHICGHQIRGLDDTILFRINWPGFDEALLESQNYEKLEMITNNNEKFQCLIPLNYGKNEDNAASYRGKDAFTLLLGLFNKNTCTLRLESYWTYEICHGRHIKQYHEVRERKTKRIHEYTLGLITSEDIIKQAEQFKQDMLWKSEVEIPTTKIDGINIPYVRVDYSDGTLCDLTNQPRVSHILYVCSDDGRHDVYSIKEVYTCEYEIIILSPILCEHPSYRPQDSPQTDLHCISMNPGPKRPRNLIQYEAESFRLLAHGGSLTSDINTGALKLDINEEKETFPSPSMTAKNIISKRVVPRTQPPLDQKLVEDFLTGDYCLHGGTGWWKFEFCYGKRVDQYHEDKDGTRAVIRLGVFDEKDHVQWMLENPGKQYKEGKKQVSHFYSGGSICDISGKPRTVEVKLKCKDTESPNSFALYLIEPDPCQYILGVESSIICSLLQYSDTLGMFQLSSTQTQDMITQINEMNYGESVDSSLKENEEDDKTYGEAEIIEENIENLQELLNILETDNNNEEQTNLDHDDDQLEDNNNNNDDETEENRVDDLS